MDTHTRSGYHEREAIPSPGGRACLSVDSRYRPDGTIDGLAGFFWEELSGAITAGTFSFNDGEYTPFNATDLALIARAMRKARQP